MTTWFIVVGMTLITFINRYLFFAERVRFKPSEAVTRFLGFSSFAILTAIWTPIIFQVDYGNFANNSELHFAYAGLDYLIATLLAAVLAAMHVRSLVVVLLSSGVFFFLRFFVFT